MADGGDIRRGAVQGVLGVGGGLRVGRHGKEDHQGP